MNHTVILRAALAAILTLTAGLTVPAADFKVGAPAKTVRVEPPATSGLKCVLVVRSAAGATLEYVPTTAGAAVTWARYSTLGGGYAEPLAGAEGYTYTLPAGDMGYIVTEAGVQTAVWVVDYAGHEFTATSLTPSAEKDCGVQVLEFVGRAEPITYYGITGLPLTLDRKLEVSYETLTFDDTTFSYTNLDAKAELDGIAGTEVRVPASLCPTIFTLTGDRFLKSWGAEVSVSSPVVAPYAVEAATEAERQGEAPENQSGATDSGLGGSAPATVEFRAVVTDAALFREWQLSSYPEFDDIDLRETALEFTHTFDRLGTTYVRFVCDNADGACQFVSTSYEVTIGESALLCPNAFSPGVSEGVNDEWRVSYRSIVEFQCTIFNRSGQKMITLTDPSQGWDGRYHGKLVPAGVYYYVIRARGADDKEYKLSGDINIVNFK